VPDLDGLTPLLPQFVGLEVGVPAGGGGPDVQPGADLAGQGDEIPFTVPGFPPRFEGREAVRAAYAAMWDASPVVIDDVETTTLHQTSEDGVVIVEQVAHGHIGKSGPAFRVPSLLVLRIHDGLIAHCRDYMDGLAVAMARRGGPASL
jgi:uncharacterized protein